MQRVTGPDGREWGVRAYRVGLPPLRDFGGDSPDPMGGGPDSLVLAAAWALIEFALALLVALVELPLAIVRGLLGRTRWVEAACFWPSETRVTWRTERGRERAVAAEVARRLAEGYEGVTPEGGTLVAMTPPAGLRDLDA